MAKIAPIVVAILGWLFIVYGILDYSASQRGFLIAGSILVGSVHVSETIRNRNQEKKTK
jgi:hypothetical protein